MSGLQVNVGQPHHKRGTRRVSLPVRAAAAEFQPSTRVLQLLLVDDPNDQRVAFWKFDSDYDRARNQGVVCLQDQDIHVSLSDEGMLTCPPPLLLLPEGSLKSSSGEDLHPGASVRPSHPPTFAAQFSL